LKPFCNAIRVLAGALLLDNTIVPSDGFGRRMLCDVRNLVLWHAGIIREIYITGPEMPEFEIDASALAD
jgi:hypothetical protein